MTEYDINFTSLNRLRKRFVKDYNLPINLFDEGIFAYYRHLYDFFPHETYRALTEKVGAEFDGNVEKWLDYCAKVRDTAIFSIMESPEYKDFNSKILNNYAVYPPVGERSVYTEVTDGHKFISIDMCKANFQVLKYMGVLKDETYADFITRNGGDEYIAGSKYLRQVIFGKLNPGRQMKIEKYLMHQIYSAIDPLLKEYGLQLFSFNNDEIIYYNEFPDFDASTLCDDIIGMAKRSVGIDVSAEYVEISRLPIVSYNDNKIDAYERLNLTTGERKLKKASTTFFPQIYKLWKGLEIEENDLYFFFENQIAKFKYPLRMEDKQNVK